MSRLFLLVGMLLSLAAPAGLVAYAATTDTESSSSSRGTASSSASSRGSDSASDSSFGDLSEPVEEEGLSVDEQNELVDLINELSELHSSAQSSFDPATGGSAYDASEAERLADEIADWATSHGGEDYELDEVAASGETFARAFAALLSDPNEDAFADYESALTDLQAAIDAQG